MSQLGRHYGLFRSLSRIWIYAVAQLPLLTAAPLTWSSFAAQEKVEEGTSPEDPLLWIYLAVAVALVLFGGVFAGLTIALMGQDEIYLQVIKTSGEPAERRNASKVLQLLKRGKHWVLVTLLLSNVITNETLPIVLDRSLGGGWPAVLGSTVLIVIFGEVIPQSICVRYGLPIGAWMSPFVLALMWILAPAAWPTAKLLDRLLGEDHGTIYKKAGLKTLVTLHKTLGVAGEQLTSDEVTIISAVLDLKEKPVGNIMTPMDDVFTMSVDTILDEDTMDVILSAGYSRIPIHAPNNPHNFVGMLLVKMLITYDPEDAKPVRDFALATLPETGPQTSCLDIVNYFQEGKSHMVLVSELPGEDTGALGVVTLEDVIEELIGEEIIDESDVFIDVHKAIRRLQPAPRLRLSKSTAFAENSFTSNAEKDVNGNTESSAHTAAQQSADRIPMQRRKTGSVDLASSPKTTFLMRRTSASNSVNRDIVRRGDTPEIREHLKHLGPSNLASRPRETRYNNVKIKRRISGAVSDSPLKDAVSTSPIVSPRTSVDGGIGEGLLYSAGKDASDGVHAVQVGYGSIDRPGSVRSRKRSLSPSPGRPKVQRKASNTSARTTASSRTTDTVKSLPTIQHPNTMPSSSRTARTGSITENIIEAGGFKKIVLETTSSSSEDGHATASNAVAEDPPSSEQSKAAKKKKRKKKKKTASSESEPLLDPDERS